MNGIGAYCNSNTHQFHSFFHMSSKHRLIGRKSSAQHDNGQRSTLDHHQTSLGLHTRFTSTTNFSLWEKVLVKRSTSKTDLRLLINTKLVPSLSNGQPKVNARERLELVGSLIPYIGLRWPYIVCV